MLPMVTAALLTARPNPGAGAGAGAGPAAAAERMRTAGAQPAAPGTARGEPPAGGEAPRVPAEMLSEMVI